MRAVASRWPRGEATRTRSPSATPSDSASAADSSTQTSGAAPASWRARPVFVRVWKWWTVRPVVSSSGNSSLGSSWGGWWTALRMARPAGLSAW
jgi:hypothetical protein